MGKYEYRFRCHDRDVWTTRWADRCEDVAVELEGLFRKHPNFVLQTTDALDPEKWVNCAIAEVLAARVKGRPGKAVRSPDGTIFPSLRAAADAASCTHAAMYQRAKHGLKGWSYAEAS